MTDKHQRLGSWIAQHRAVLGGCDIIAGSERSSNSMAHMSHDSGVVATFVGGWRYVWVDQYG